MILIDRLHTEESLSTEAKIKASHGICPLSGHKCMCPEFIEQQAPSKCPGGLYEKREGNAF